MNRFIPPAALLLTAVPVVLLAAAVQADPVLEAMRTELKRAKPPWP